MRRPIAVQVEPFDIESIQPRLDKIRETFGRYLDSVKKKSTSSKYGLMGAVGKILTEVKSGRCDPSSLKGYALRVHEQAHSRPLPSTITDLETGIEELVLLFNEVPLSSRSRMIDRLDYGLYFDMRKRDIERFEAVKKQWCSFLVNKYSTVAKLNESWNTSFKTFEEVTIDKKSTKPTSKKEIAVNEFWESVGKDKELLSIEEE